MNLILVTFWFYLYVKNVPAQTTTLFPSSSPTFSVYCSRETNHFGDDVDVQWPFSSVGSEAIASSPWCLDEQKFVTMRNCTYDGWVPKEAANCSSIQVRYVEANKCPLGYEEMKWKSKYLCVRLTVAQPWNNTCLSSGSGLTIFDLDSDEEEGLLSFLRNKTIRQVWMPAKRFNSYGPVMWTLPGDIYGDSVEFDDLSVRLSSEIYEDGCFSLNVTNRRFSGAIENCKKYYPIMCLLKTEKSLIQLACPDGFYTSSYEGHQDRCYRTHMIQQAATTTRANELTNNWVASECRGELFSMASIEKTVIYESLAKISNLNSNDRCLFGVMPNVYVTSKQQWTSIVPTINYVNWASNSGPGNLITADRHGKWYWTNDVLTCIACQRKLEIHKPKIVLKFYQPTGKLYAVVYDRQYIWKDRSDDSGIKCFTNADYELVKGVKVHDEVWTGHLSLGDDMIDISNYKTKTVYELKLYGDGPGYYWCEAHALPDFQLIQSDKLVAFKKLKGEVFAVLMEIRCQRCEQYFQNKYAKELAQHFRDFLRNLIRQQRLQPHDMSIENVRVMKIESIDAELERTRVLFHVSISLEDDDFDDSEEDVLELTSDMVKVYKIRNYLRNLLLSARSTEYTYVSLKSTEFCLPDSISTVSSLSWLSARIGDISAPKELCLLASGLPVRRSCVGNFIDGGSWLNTTKQECTNDNFSPITQSLYDLDRFYVNPQETSQVIEKLSSLISNYSAIIPADLFYLSKVMQTMTKFNNDSTLLNENEKKNIFTIYNNLMMVDENITKKSAALNSTNILLDAFDNTINHLSSANNSLLSSRINLTENLNDGTIAVLSSKFISYSIDPMVSNVTGIALYRKNRDEILIEEDFSDYFIKLLYANQSTVALLEEYDLEIASFVPQSLLDRLNETRIWGNRTASNETVDPPVKIVITIYYNDLLFQEYKNMTHAKAGGKIISVTIPGYGPSLPELLPIFIKTDNFTDNSTDDICGYWSFKSDDQGWARDGCEYAGSSGYFEPIVLCACSHLTHFAYLVLGTYVHTISSDDDVIITEYHQGALDMITLLGCSLSLVGILGIAITAIIFSTWREKPSTKVLLQLSAAIALQMILLCFVNTEITSPNLLLEEKWYECVALGAFLHYSVLVAFTWMLITAYLQFMRYVRVLGHTRSTRFFLKSFLIGWGIPLVPVLIVVFITPNSYIPNLEFLVPGICYPTGYALYFGVIVPIGLIITANCIIFILVLYNIIRGPDGKLRTSERDLTLSQLRLSIFLFFLLGLSWIFGFAASTKAGLVFSYLFCLTATLQGFVLFLYFIIMDPTTRKLWGKFLKKYLFCSKDEMLK